jgi:polar amino acid transport system permease protein
MFDWSVVTKAMPLLLEGTGMTLFLSVMAVVIGFGVGVIVCTARLSPVLGLRIFGRAYLTVFRGIPLLVQLFVGYSALPVLGLDLPALLVAVGAIGLCAGAYMSEILRGGFLSIPRGQKEAAVLMGFSPAQRVLRIELPQVVRDTLPALINEAILLVKASSLISVVGIAELTRISQNMAASSFRYFEFYIAAAVIYLVINGSLALFGHWLEHRLRKQVVA